MSEIGSESMPVRPEPSEKAVRIHAVKEGAICAVTIGGGVFALGEMAAESFIGTERMEEIRANPEEDQLTPVESIMILAPVVAGAGIGVYIYRKISSKIRRQGGSFLIGFRGGNLPSEERIV